MRYFFFGALILMLSYTSVFSAPRAGFYLPDSVQEVSLTYRKVNSLIVLPVTINDTVHLNLILDTGCRNLVLFGERFQKYFNIHNNREIKFSGLGEGSALNGMLSLDNKVTINKVLGEKIPIIIVPRRNLFKKSDHIDGIIGYDIFIRFEIELNPLVNSIKFRPALNTTIPDGFTPVPIRIEDSRPLLNSTVFLAQGECQDLDIMIDTGSSLGLLLKATAENRSGDENQLIGKGLNGVIEGSEAGEGKMLLTDFEMNDKSVHIIRSRWHTYGSVGMQVLNDYAIVLNYCKAYVCFKKI